MVADLEFVSSLLKCNSKNVLCLNGRGLILGIDLYDIVVTLSLTLEYLKRLGLVAGGDNSVGHLAREKLCGHNVAGIGKSNPVSKGAKAVCSSCANVGASQGGLVKILKLFNEASLLKRLVKRKSNCRACGRNVLKGGCGGNAENCLKLLYKLPRVKRVKEVYVSGSAVKHLDGKLTLILHKNSCRLLIGVTAVFKLKFFHFTPHAFLFTILVSLSPLLMSM